MFVFTTADTKSEANAGSGGSLVGVVLRRYLREFLVVLAVGNTLTKKEKRNEKTY
jgi:hypothetical protein